MSDTAPSFGWSMDVVADDDGVAACLDDFDRYASASELGETLRRKMGLVLDEVLTNIARCAYEGDEEGRMWVALEALSPGRYRLAFEDAGVAFNPLYAQAPDTGLAITERKVGGLGIFLVRKLSAKLFYERRDGRNRLRIDMVST